MTECGTQCMICDFPIHLDTYIGCAHACKYCFAREKQSIATVRPLDNLDALRRFIEGHRTNETRWCDWKIPVHWGSSSDPFQRAELIHGRSLEALELFAETGYPFIVSTKNPVLAAQEPYLGLLAKCRCVFQISMAAPEYDKLEPGAPTYEERLEAAAILSEVCTRVIARVQPYFTDQYKAVLREIPRYKQAGIYGIIVEGYATRKKQKGLVKDGKYGFPVEVLAPQFKQIRERAHQNGLRFFLRRGQAAVFRRQHELLRHGRAGGFQTEHVQHRAHRPRRPDAGADRSDEAEGEHAAIPEPLPDKRVGKAGEKQHVCRAHAADRRAVDSAVPRPESEVRRVSVKVQTFTPKAGENE